jgi:hypothetical protein
MECHLLNYKTGNFVGSLLAANIFPIGRTKALAVEDGSPHYGSHLLAWYIAD